MSHLHIHNAGEDQVSIRLSELGNIKYEKCGFWKGNKVALSASINVDVTCLEDDQAKLFVDLLRRLKSISAQPHP